MNNVRDRAGRSICNWMHLFIYYNTYVHLDTYNHIAGEGVLNLQKLWCAFTAVTFSFFSISELQLFHCTYRHHYFTLHREHQIAKKRKFWHFSLSSLLPVYLCVCFQWNTDMVVSFTFHWDHIEAPFSFSFSACNIWYTQNLVFILNVFNFYRLRELIPQFTPSLFLFPCSTVDSHTHKRF